MWIRMRSRCADMNGPALLSPSYRERKQPGMDKQNCKLLRASKVNAVLSLVALFLGICKLWLIGGEVLYSQFRWLWREVLSMRLIKGSSVLYIKHPVGVGALDITITPVEITKLTGNRGDADSLAATFRAVIWRPGAFSAGPFILTISTLCSIHCV